MIVSHVVAISENRVIGKNGGMPWHIPEDFKFFKAKTMGHAMIMGRKTFDSIGRPLPGRLSIVVTRRQNLELPPGVVKVGSVAEALDYCQRHADQWGDEAFVIGGGEIFAETMDQVDRIYLTQIHQAAQGDVFYPEIPKGEFEVTHSEKGTGPVPFTWLTYERRRS